MALSDVKCRKAKCPDGKKQIKFTDERGMYLLVNARGGKYLNDSTLGDLPPEYVELIDRYDKATKSGKRSIQTNSIAVTEHMTDPTGNDK